MGAQNIFGNFSGRLSRNLTGSKCEAVLCPNPGNTVLVPVEKLESEPALIRFRKKAIKEPKAFLCKFANLHVYRNPLETPGCHVTQSLGIIWSFMCMCVCERASFLYIHFTKLSVCQTYRFDLTK